MEGEMKEMRAAAEKGEPLDAATEPKGEAAAATTEAEKKVSMAAGEEAGAVSMETLGEKGRQPVKEKRSTKVSLGLAKLKWRSNLRKDRKPADTAFSQQRLMYWQPIVVPRVILPFYFIFGFTFIAIGILVTISAMEFQVVVLDYTRCDVDANKTFHPIHPEEDQWNSKWKYNSTTKVCTLQFTLEKDLEGPVQLYYQLTNFNQNNRRYIQSKNTNQLLGAEILDPSKLSECGPLVTPPNSTVIYYPCGLIANSIFNDTFSNFTKSTGETYSFSEKGIAWVWEHVKVANTQYTSDADGVFRKIMPPPEWTRYNGVYTTENIPRLGEDEHFMVWIRISAGPSFRKLYAHSNDTLVAGTYTLDVVSQYEVRSFRGTKSVVIQHQTWLDGVGPNLGYSFLAVGAVMLVTGTILVLANYLKPRKVGDASLLSWNREST